MSSFCQSRCSSYWLPRSSFARSAVQPVSSRAHTEAPATQQVFRRVRTTARLTDMQGDSTQGHTQVSVRWLGSELTHGSGRSTPSPVITCSVSSSCRLARTEAQRFSTRAAHIAPLKRSPRNAEPATAWSSGRHAPDVGVRPLEGHAGWANGRAAVSGTQGGRLRESEEDGGRRGRRNAGSAPRGPYTLDHPVILGQ